MVDAWECDKNRRLEIYGSADEQKVISERVKTFQTELYATGIKWNQI